MPAIPQSGSTGETDVADELSPDRPPGDIGLIHGEMTLSGPSTEGSVQVHLGSLSREFNRLQMVIQALEKENSCMRNYMTEVTSAVVELRQDMEANNPAGNSSQMLDSLSRQLSDASWRSWRGLAAQPQNHDRESTSESRLCRMSKARHQKSARTGPEATPAALAAVIAEERANGREPSDLAVVPPMPSQDLSTERCENEQAEEPRSPSRPSEPMEHFRSSRRSVMYGEMLGAIGGNSGPKGQCMKAAIWLTEYGAPIVILLNSLTLGTSSDFLPDHPAWTVVESMFMTFYTFECVVKLWFLGCKGYFMGRGWSWNWFDFTCLVLSYSELGITLALTLSGAGSDIVRDMVLLKVLRLSRLMRILRALEFDFFSEVKLMIVGILNGMMVLFWAIVVLLVLIYVLGILMRNLVGGEIEEFRSVVDAMLTLFRCFVDGCSAYDGTPLADRLARAYGLPIIVGYIVVMMLVTVGIFNMIMAMFIDKAVSAASRRKQKELSESARETEKAIKRMVAQLSIDPAELKQRPKLSARQTLMKRHEDKLPPEEKFEELRKLGARISKEIFQDWLHIPAFLSLLQASDIDTTTKYDLFDILDADMGGSLELDEVVTGLMKLRGPVSKNDIIAIRLKVGQLVQSLPSSDEEQLNSEVGFI